ncbi:hypothetical protein [Candidatus Anaplasma sp. TIGMIC]|uniref:hypothetical protein n=1 Tax=Candidatus Anaplasma sp. TIGMIC TaxID=3020713 RepID=UPI00232CA10F|nr:hypothetical protein [Candidatus Anaplasma sp. TIGMIC]MDB1135266.1 hypothetical protein [Candidatus Anaplasma sp. TIGMIC]
MSGHNGDNAVLFVVVGAFAAAVGYVLGVLAAYFQMGGGVGHLAEDEAELQHDQDVQEEDLVENEDRWRVNEQHPVDMALEGWGEVAGYLIVRDVEDGLMSFVRDESYMGSGRRQ